MKNVFNLMLIFSLLFLGAERLQAQQEEKFTLSGHVKDADTGEELISASLYIEELKTGNVTNVYGYYSITLPKGNYKVTYNYIGYQDFVIEISLDADMRKDIELLGSLNAFDEVTIVAEEEEKDKNVQSVDMSKITVDIEAVKKMPALFGEVDIIKTIQLLPGVKSVGEGTSGFYVRGGNADQNLVLLDEAPIYNASHLLGFFSSFNPDAIKDMQLSKGAIDARYGGRLSSVLDIRMKEGNSKSFAGAGGIGSIMSRLAIEAPLGDKGSFIVSGRRSYLDIMAKLVLAARDSDEADTDFSFYFYDLNAKANYRLNQNDRLFASGYFGRDVMADPNEGFDISWGNKTSTLRWNHIFSPKLFSNLTFYYSSYDYGLGVEEGISNIDWDSNLTEYSTKADFTYYPSPNHNVEMGFQSILHQLSPGQISLVEQGELLSEIKIENANSLENAAYISDEYTLNNDFTVKLGLRVSSLHNIGPKTHTLLDENYQELDSVRYEGGIYNSYYNLEPRLGLRYSLSDQQSIKASYNRTTQYIQQASNGNAATPFDIWFTSSPVVKPQLADQYTLGYFRNFNQNAFEFSIEVYYKNFKSAIDFKERAQLLLNKNLESELRIGKARAYGLEVMLKKDKGRLTGWLSYTYSKIEKNIDQINDGNWYNAKYDKPHDLALVASYALSKRISLSSNFVYSSGNAVTFPTGKYVYKNTVIPVYSDRNSARLPNFHRMDFSLTLRGKKNDTRRWKSEYVFSIYNVYNRKNALAINFKQDQTQANQTYAEKLSVFSIIPSVSYNVKF